MRAPPAEPPAPSLPHDLQPLSPVAAPPVPSPFLPAPGALAQATSPTTAPTTTTATTTPAAAPNGEDPEATPPRSNLVLSVGLGSLLAVPLLRAWAGLPPHMGMLACLGFLWLVTDAIHFGEERRWVGGGGSAMAWGRHGMGAPWHGMVHGGVVLGVREARW